MAGCGARRSLRLCLAAACLSLLGFDLAGAVDKSKFRTCEQGSFCRRYRHYVAKLSQGAEPAHQVDVDSISQQLHQQHVVTARITQVHDPSVPPLKLEVSWYRDAVQGRCGITRIQVTEEAPMSLRFTLREGDVITADAELKADEVTMQAGQGEHRFTSSAPGECSVVLRHRPLEIDFVAGGRLLQRMNAKHLMNFERYRPKSFGGHKGLVDATDASTENLWEEKFGGHTDTKPRGPAAVGVDMTFVGASVVAGLAEHAAKLHLGENNFEEPYRLYNLDVFEYELDVPMALYGAVPFVTAIHRWPGAAATASGFFMSNPSEGFVQVDRPIKTDAADANSLDNTNTWWLFESGVIDAFVFAGPSPRAVLEQYHTVTGWPRLPPIATIGKHQCRWNYVDVADAVNVNKKFDENDIPYDVLWLDIEHTDEKKYFTWHPSHFAKPDDLLNVLNASKRKLVTIVDPHLKLDSTYDVYNQLKNQDLLTKTKDSAQYDGWCWPGSSVYADFCNPATRDQWAKFFSLSYYPHSRPDLYTWNDMNEPSVFNGPEVTMPRDNLHKCHTDGFGIEHRDVHNVYGFYHHMATVQGHLERAPNVRPFVLTRSFFAGSHKHGAVWTGDNQARWGHLSRSVPMLLSLALVGISFAGADVPGFFYDPEPELYRRWHQLGIWYPFYRGHAHLETKRREPWMMGDSITAMMREQITVRYQLLPMWYTLFAEWAGSGLPILRPLWFDNLDDAEAYNHVNENFMVGASILVHAVSETENSIGDFTIYFPKGEWFDVHYPHSMPPHQGGMLRTFKLHPNSVPAFVRSGSILFKKMRRRRSTGAMIDDPYTILVYGKQASGRVYVDDGDSHDYQNGAYVYDELSFDGTELQAKPAPAGALFKFGEAKGLASAPQRRLRVERLVFLALTSKPTGAQVLINGQGSAALLSADPGSDGTWKATVKKPPCLLGSTWSLRMEFEATPVLGV